MYENLSQTIHAISVFLALSGLVLALISAFNYHETLDLWVKERAPHPTLVLGFWGALFFIFNYATDLLIFPMVLFFDGIWIVEGIRNSWHYIVGFPIATVIIFSVLYYMARVKGGFISAVALVIALGGVGLLLF